MKLIFEQKHKQTLWFQITIVLLPTISLLPACSDVDPPIKATPAKTMTVEVTPTSPVEIQEDPTAVAEVSVNYSFPDKIEPEERYLLYLHGKIIENEGIGANSPEYGPYEFEEILKYFAQAGFNVIGEVRSPNTDIDEYSDKVTSQINTLLEQGVPSESITVVGFSKGGAIAIFTSSKLGNPRVNFVLLAICGDEINEVSEVSLAGRILSLYEESDELGSTCKPLVDRSPDVSGFDEIELSTGLRHGAFYSADSTWLEPLISWIFEGGA